LIIYMDDWSKSCTPEKYKIHNKFMWMMSSPVHVKEYIYIYIYMYKCAYIN